jgi:hypothetical protein
MRKKAGERQQHNTSREGGGEHSYGLRESSFSFLNDYIAPAILQSTSVDHLLEHLVNISAMDIPQPSIAVPLYDRAYPTRGYAKDLFWHNLGIILSVALIVYFSVPAAIAAKEFSRDALTGQFDSLLTLPGITVPVICTSSVAACWITSLMPFTLVFLLFLIILKFTSPLIPALALLLMSVSLGSIAVVISSLTKNVETAVVMVPTIVFLMTLPGMVYYDLAFDVQRTLLVECVLCVLPPSAAIIILRSVCTMESLSLPLLLSTASLVANVPTFVHLLILTFDGVFFYGIALLCSSYQFQLQRKQYISQHDAICNVVPEHVASSRNRFFSCLTSAWQLFMSSHSNHSTSNNNTSGYELVSMGQADERPHPQYYQYGPDEEEEGGGKYPASTTTAGLIVSDISKSFISTEKECAIEVLSHIRAMLHDGSVTTLLGSNGGTETRPKLYILTICYS